MTPQIVVLIIVGVFVSICLGLCFLMEYASKSKCPQCGSKKTTYGRYEKESYPRVCLERDTWNNTKCDKCGHEYNDIYDSGPYEVSLGG
jgi:hypothetical protein